ncbi:MAG TPA: GNAT family N-acetyltransferase [Kaistia sp.]|nr:GNAT family N-acetyltransferase [Kaistia sp.]
MVTQLMPPDWTMRTARLTLRPILGSDAEALVEGLGDFEVARWLSRVPYPYTLDEARRFIAWEKAERVRGEDRVVGIDAGGLVGIASLRGRGAEPVLGYWMARRHWGQGYMTEAVGALIAAAFESPEVTMIRSGVFEGNQRSLAIQTRFGFVVSGHSRLHNLALGRDLAHIDTQLTRARHQEFTP